MAMEGFLSRLEVAAGRTLSAAARDTLAKELTRRAAAREPAAVLEGRDGTLRALVEELASELAQAVQIERRRRLIDRRVFAEALAATEKETRELSARARATTLLAQYLGGMIAELREQDLLPLLNSRALEQEITLELAELSKAQGAPGRSGSTEAASIARIIDTYRRLAVALENRAGAWIRPGEGSVLRQSHDLQEIRRTGFAAWRDAVLPLLDRERTFRGVAPETYLRAAFDDIVAGQHIRAQGAGETDLTFAFADAGEIQRRTPAHPVLQFRDAEAWLVYNRRFGRGSLMAAVFHELDRAAQNTALMEIWGSAPLAMFAKVRGTSRLRQGREAALQPPFDQVEGVARRPETPSAALVGATMAAAEGMADLGRAALSAFGDLGVKAASLRGSGDNLLSAWAKSFEAGLVGLAPEQRRTAAELLSVGLAGQIGGLAVRFFAADAEAGSLARLQQMLFKLDLRGPLLEGQIRGRALMAARDLAIQADRDWSELPRRALLESYGFDAVRWDLARRALRQAPDGRDYLLPEAIGEAGDDTAVEVEIALRAYYADLAEAVLPVPELEAPAVRDEPFGVALSLLESFAELPLEIRPQGGVAQIEPASTAAFRNALARGRADLQGLVRTIVSATLLGFAAETAEAVAGRRRPRDPFSAETWREAMLRGGALGFYADFLFGELRRLGSGPVAADELAALLARARGGEVAAAEALGELIEQPASSKLFYTRVALDYLILFQLQETLNPGFLDRTQRRIRKDLGQRRVLPPSVAVPRGRRSRSLEGAV